MYVCMYMCMYVCKNVYICVRVCVNSLKQGAISSESKVRKHVPGQIALVYDHCYPGCPIVRVSLRSIPIQ